MKPNQRPTIPTMLSAIFKHWPYIVFAALILMVLIFAIGNMSSPNEPGQGPDEMLHISLHLTMMNAVKSGLGDFVAPLADSMRKPHLPYLVSSLFSSIAPAGFASLLAANYFFHLLWLVAVFLIAKKIAASAAGAVSACVMAALPMTWRLGEHFGNDMPLAFFVALALLILIEYELFVGFWIWPILGLICGIGMLSKPTLPLYVAGAAGYVALRSLRQAAMAPKKGAILLVGAGIIIAPVIAAIAWLPWFAHPIGAISELFGKISADAGHTHGFFHTINGKIAPQEMIERLGLLGAFAVFGGLLAAIWQFRDEKAKILIFSFLPPLFVFTIITQAFTRLMFPVLLVPIILGCSLLVKISSGLVRSAAMIGIAALALCAYFVGHEHTRPALWPMHEISNPAYVAEPAADLIESRMVPTSDLLVVSRCRFQNLPKTYFVMLSMQDIPHLEITHLWDETGLYPGVLFHKSLPRRLGHVKWILECREESEADDTAISTSIQGALDDAYRHDGIDPKTISRRLPAFRHVQHFPIAFEWGAENFHLHLYERVE